MPTIDQEREHNYQIKLNRLIAEGKLPDSGAWHVEIEHDSWCGAHRSQRCNCDPDIYLCRNENRVKRRKL